MQAAIPHPYRILFAFSFFLARTPKKNLDSFSQRFSRLELEAIFHTSLKGRHPAKEIQDRQPHLIGLQEVSMVKRFSTLVLVIALVCALAGNSAFAITLSDSGTKANVAEARAEAGPAPKKAAKPNDRLRRDCSN